MKRNRYWRASLCLLCGLLLAAFLVRVPFSDVIQKLRGKHTVSDRVTQFGPQARSQWQPILARHNLEYPPRKLLLLGLEREKQLQVFASDKIGKWRLLQTFPVLAASGKLGPKLRFGDRQVPEGFYAIESLNPNSAYHLALRVNYPNQFDRAQAQKENRSELGGDIMVHGSNASIGCLAMGDAAIEKLFVLAADAGIENIAVIFSPLDFREADAPKQNRAVWIENLYRDIAAQIKMLPQM